MNNRMVVLFIELEASRLHDLDFLRYFDNTSRDLEFSRVSMHLVWHMHGFDHF